MKKLLPYFLIVLFSGFLISCNSDDNNSYVDNDTVANVYELTNVNFELKTNSSNQTYYAISRSFQQPIYASDMVLIYKQDGIINNDPKQPIWVLLPKTYNVNQGFLEYTFDFSRNDIQIYADADFNLANTEYIRNQTFRVLVVPAILGRSVNPVDFNNYQATVNYYNLQNAKVVKL